MASTEHRTLINEEKRSAPVVQQGGIAGWIPNMLSALLGVLLFILALELIKDGAREYGRELLNLLRVTNAVNSLGFGWLLAYIFLSGSPVAAIAISFFASGTLDSLQAFTMITGSRLGASFIVLLIGFAYRLRGHHQNDSLAIGILAFLTTTAIYLPALPLGLWALTSGWLPMPQLSADAPLASFLDQLYGPLLALVDSWDLPGALILVIGVACLMLALNLLDRALPDVQSRQNEWRRLQRLFERPLAMFLIGAAITSLTLSVSVSLSILVPLAVRGVVRRNQTIPYIMGANITTFIDTLVAALIVGGVAAFMIVLVEMISVALLSLLILFGFYPAFARTLLKIQEWITSRSMTLLIFLGVVLIVPIILMLL